MKKIVVVIALLITLTLTACQSGESFEGTVIRIDESSAVVEPFEGEEIRRSGDEVSVSIQVDTALEVGDHVKITHEGPVMESHPLQINTISIEILD